MKFININHFVAIVCLKSIDHKICLKSIDHKIDSKFLSPIYKGPTWSLSFLHFSSFLTDYFSVLQTGRTPSCLRNCVLDVPFTWDILSPGLCVYNTFSLFRLHFKYPFLLFFRDILPDYPIKSCLVSHLL